jgi:hypothetical protein
VRGVIELRGQRGTETIRGLPQHRRLAGLVIGRIEPEAGDVGVGGETFVAVGLH